MATGLRVQGPCLTWLTIGLRVYGLALTGFVGLSV